MHNKSVPFSKIAQSVLAQPINVLIAARNASRAFGDWIVLPAAVNANRYRRSRQVVPKLESERRPGVNKPIEYF